MVENIGYFKEFENDTHKFVTRCVVRGKTNTYGDNLPKDNDGDCYRVSLIDGTLVVKKWVSKNRDFIFIMASSSFKIEQK